jgi:Porin PorA
VNRAVMLRFAACGIIGLGAALLIAALLLSTYTSSRITKIPLDIDTTLISDGTGTALDSASLSSDHVVINQNVPLVSQQQVTVESPANADVVTLQAGTSVRRTDKQKDSGLLLAIVDTVTLNRKTAMAVSDDTHTGGAVQKPRSFTDENPPTAIPLRHDGLSYRFPFHTEKKTYPCFDPIAQKAFDVNYDSQEDVNGLTTYRFTQNVGYNAEGKLVAPVKYPSLYAGDEDGKVTTSAAMWGLQGGDPAEQITMTRYYAAQRTFWVDPVSGTIVKKTEHANHYFARDPLKPEVTLADYKVTSTEDTVESQVNSARDERDRLALWSRVLPITFTAVGLIALIGGGLLASFSLRTESALIDPGLDRADHDFFGRGGPEAPVPGAEAETEKLPTQRPDLHHDPSPPGSEPPRPGSAESGAPDSGPADPNPPGPSGPPERI